METLGDRVRQCRELMGYTREQLGEVLDVSFEHIANIELKKRKMSIELLEKMSKLFCVSTDYLLLGRETPNTPALTITDMLAGLTDEERKLAADMLRLTIRALRAGK